MPSLNEYVNTERGNRYGGAGLKRNNTQLCAVYCRAAMNQGFKFDNPSVVHCTWYMKNKRKDPDNIAFAIKFILDGMMKVGLIKNDNWEMIKGLKHDFVVDKEHPRVEIELEES